MRCFRLFPALLLAHTAGAQLPAFQGNFGVQAGVTVPTGEFADTWGSPMFTLGGQFSAPLGLMPLQSGLNFGYGFMDRTSAELPLSDPVLTADHGTLEVRAKTLAYHPFLRMSPLRGKLRPYVEGLVGLRQFTTFNTVRVDGLDEPLQRDRTANDFVFSSGWAAGLQMGWGGIGYVEARVERFHGGQATYVDPASVTVDPAGAVAFNTLNSRTDLVNVLLGIGIRF